MMLRIQKYSISDVLAWRFPEAQCLAETLEKRARGELGLDADDAWKDAKCTIYAEIGYLEVRFLAPTPTCHYCNEAAQSRLRLLGANSKDCIYLCETHDLAVRAGMRAKSVGYHLAFIAEAKEEE